MGAIEGAGASDPATMFFWQLFFYVPRFVAMGAISNVR